MGQIFARLVLNLKRPTVGLLNVGSEEQKGHEELRDASAILRQIDLPMEFIGFVEGDDITAGTVDVIVTDGFSGNIALKAAEGTSRMFTFFLKEAFGSSIYSKIGYVFSKTAINQVRERMDPRKYNGAVFLGLLKPGDTIMGMSLNSGGHITHGLKISMSGKWFNAIGYEVDKESELIDYDNVEKLALEHKPKLIIAGGSAYSRVIDFKRFREIADKVGAYLMVDMAHFSGLVAGKGYPNPCDYAHVVTSTTHKVFRSARGGIILTNHEDLSKKFNTAVFPGYQGGPLMHIIAAKAVGFKEALKPEFKDFIITVLANAKILSETLKNNGFKIYSGGTDTHLMLVDLRPFNVKGNVAAESLSRANITCNKNGIPFDSESPMITSGIRLGSQAATTRGFGLKEFQIVGDLITKTIKGLAENPEDNSKTEDEVRKEVVSLCSNFPIYKHLG